MDRGRDMESEDDYPRLVLSMRTKVSILGLCFILTVSLVAYSNIPNVVEALRNVGQGPEEDESKILWSRTYPETGSAALTGNFQADRVIDAPGGYLVIGGNRTGDQYANPKTYLLRVDRDGNTVWEKTLQNGSFSHVSYAATCEDDSYRLVGTGGWFMKIDDQGNEIWRNEYEPNRTVTKMTGFIGRDWYDARPSSDGRFFYMEAELLTELDQEGDVVSQRAWEPQETKYLAGAPGGGFFSAWILNYTFPAYFFQTTFSRLDQNLEPIWQIPLGGMEIGEPLRVIQTTDGGTLLFKVMHQLLDGGPTTPGINMTRLDDKGQVLWEMNYSVQTDLEHSYPGLTELEDGSYIVTGTVCEPPGTKPDTWGIQTHAFLIKADPAGQILWAKSYETDMGLGGPFEMDDGSLLFFDGYRIMKLDAWGNVIWEYEGNWKGGSVSRVTNGDFLIAGSTPAEISGEVVEVACLTRLRIGTDPPIPEKRPDEVIYDEGQEEWTMTPEPSLTIDPLSTATCTSGNMSMALTNRRIGYLDLHPPGEEGFDTYGYATIDLAINRGNCTAFTPQIVGQYKYGGGFSRDLTKITAFPENRWVRLSLSLEDLGAGHQIIERIRIGGYTPGTFYVDNVRFTSSMNDRADAWVAGAVVGLIAFESKLIRRKAKMPPDRSITAKGGDTE